MMYASSRRCGWSLRVAEVLYTVRLIVLLVGGVLASSGDFVLAQIIPDGTLLNNSVVTLSGNTNLITGGTTAGSNLFHSFQQFSVPTGGTAYFNNTLDIQNIITRVTGSSISNIDGKLQANGTANLFLLNPNGIIFSRNASLNIGGSFLASTASSLNFADGTHFGATTPQTTPLLTISVPIGLQFGGTAGGILNQSQATNSSGRAVGLAVQPGKTLMLVGGDIAIEGGRLTAAGGRIELGSIDGIGLVRLNSAAQGWSLGYEGVQNFRDIQLSQQAVVDASGEGGGNIQVQGRRVTLTDKSDITANALGSRNAGEISIQALQLAIQNGAQVSASAYGTGNGGNLVVTAFDSVDVIGTSADGAPSALFTRTFNTGIAGDLRINARRLIVADGAQVGANASGQGRGGTLSVNVSDFVELRGTSPNGQSPSGLFAGTKDSGAAGDVRIATEQLIVRDRAEVNISGLGSGDAGDLKVAARSIQLDNQAALRAESASGNGGNIWLQVQDLLLIGRNSQISVQAFKNGNGGNIKIHAPLVVVVSPEDSDIVPDAQQGKGGRIVITADVLLNTSNFGRLINLPTEVVDASRQIAQNCPARGSRQQSSFTITGAGGLPTRPGDLMNSPFPTGTVRAIPSNSTLRDAPSNSVFVTNSSRTGQVREALATNSSRQNEKAENPSGAASSHTPTTNASAPLVEAQGWVYGSNGEVILTAQAPTINPHDSWSNTPTCD